MSSPSRRSGPSKKSTNESSQNEAAPKEVESPEVLRQHILRLEADKQEMQVKIDYLERDIDRIARYFDQLQHDVQSIEHSTAWRLGYGLVAILKKLMGRRSTSPIFETIHGQLTIYHHWKKSRG